MTLRAAALAALFALTGCTGFVIDPPEDFVVLEEPDGGPFALRASSADGVVLGVRELPGAENASLTFWARAVAGRLETARGYRRTGEEAVRAESGEEGRLLAFSRSEGGEEFTYWAAVFPAPPAAPLGAPRLYLVEAGGPKAAFEAARPALKRSLRSLRID
ncbi:MAG: hypothetical protein D6731_10120 [Planctomycetota bacterium]|nr:MAG: hypothetical protein D6731_10120 [Planctomycetota bacterium]